MRNGELGFWWRSLGGAPSVRPPLAGPTEVDVAIVGAGYTGLWTAYYLKQSQPSLKIVILEREFAGYGASGRNGGWVTGFFSGPPHVYERRGGRQGYLALQRAMFDTVGELARVVGAHEIDAELLECGQLEVALNGAQLARLRERIRDARERGLGEQDLRELDPRELEGRLAVKGARGASFSAHVARVHPAKLLVGLAALVEQLGVAIHERTPVTEIRPHEALTPLGSVRARWVVRATEGYTGALAGLGRALVPINSSMIVTQRLSAEAWEQIGWRGREALSDGAHVYVYLQRTQDGRIAIGGRGVPYRFGSGTGGSGATAPASVEDLRSKLGRMFPAVAGVEIDHAWSGVLGVARDWCVSIEADPSSGLAWAGGYVGQGLASANLAGRVLRDLMLDLQSPLTALPWVGRRPRGWEPEPLRWGGIRGVYSLYRLADRIEQRTDRPSRVGRFADAVSGRH